MADFGVMLRDALTLLRITEERSRSQEYETHQSSYAVRQILDALHRFYVEAPVSRGALTVAQARAGAIHLETQHPLAVSSNDHLEPDSTQEGIARPTSFVVHCTDIVGRDSAWLDIGCGAAGLVYEAAMQGVLAFGIDGSDHCRRHGIGYWPLLPASLKTCDVTEPFAFRSAGGVEQVRFDLVSAWEVLEHIDEARINALLTNVRANLADGGYFIGSVSLLEYASPSGLPYHVTLKPKAWWAERFAQCGLSMLETSPFDTRLFPRGNGPRFQDFHNYHLRPDEGFHFVAQAAQGARA